ncbi:MAG TPA: hypothetical protein VKA87_02695 [Nitrososphaeraceae archaeon]|nr:hypothetical protein [Nitrososphaeraceae archaeon]
MTNIKKLEKAGGIGKEIVSDENRETKSQVWFTHTEDRYNAELKGTQKVFYWTDQQQMWDWDNCTVSWLLRDRNTPSSIIRIVIRSLNSVFSEYLKKEVKIRYMLGFDVEASRIQPPEEERYNEPIDNKPKKYGQERIRWVVKLDKDYSIWQWKEEGMTIESSKVYEIYKGIMKSLDEPIIPNAKDIFNVVAYDDNKIGKKIVPVVYQAAIDSWKNFVREVHCHALDNGQKIQVSILFNNEQLREHKIANRFYEWFRSWFYGRVIDVETFFVLLKDDNNNPELFDFPLIYSAENSIEQDSIHIDRYGITIKYYFANLRHPIIFINTSNHAMGEHDTNHRLWKWEYIAWQKDGPIEFGQKSRQEIDNSFKPKLRFW